MEQTTNKKQILLAKIAIVVGITCASGTGILVKKSFGYGADSLTVIALRMIFTLPLFLAIGIWYIRKNRTLLKNFSVKLIGKIAAVGLLGYYLTSYTSFIGLEYISASMERVVMFVYPTILVLLSAVLFRKKVDMVQIMPIVLTYLGVVISFSDRLGTSGNENMFIGIGIILLSASLFALNLLLSRELIQQSGAIPVTVISLCASAVVIIAQYFIVHENQLLKLPVEVYANVGIMAVCTTMVPALLMGYALKHLSAIEVSIISCIGPPAGFVLASVFLHEQISMVQILGSTVVISGVVMLQLRWDPLALFASKRMLR